MTTSNWVFKGFNIPDIYTYLQAPILITKDTDQSKMNVNGESVFICDTESGKGDLHDTDR